MPDEQTGSRDERPPDKYITDDHRVSKAPLHLAYPLRRNLSKKKLNELVEEGYVIHRGRFTEKENKRLLKNWRRVCRRYPELNNPFAASGLSNKPDRNQASIVDTVVDGKTKKFFKYSKILERLAYKLDDRLLCDIYNRAKKVIGGQAFKYSSRNELPEELVEKAKESLLDPAETFKDLSSELDINPSVLRSIKRKPTKLPTHNWTDQDDLLLEMSIERQANNKDPWTLPFAEIDWEEVSKEMITYGLPKEKMSEEHLYQRWYFLNGQMAKSIKRRLISLEDTMT